MRMLPLLLVLALAGPADAEVQTFYLRHSDAPVTVPGGAASFLLDATVPSAPVPLIQEQVTPKDTTTTFPTFVSAPFAADTPLLPIASVRLHLSANAKMRECATTHAEVFTVDGTGALTSIGNGKQVATTVEQGSSGGTVGFGSNRVEFPIDPTTVSAGHGLAVSTALGNDCGTNRRTFLAYDSDDARSRLRFQCCFTTAAKCAAKKLERVKSITACRFRPHATVALIGDRHPLDPVQFQKCAAQLVRYFASAEKPGTCPSVGDAPSVAAAIDAFVTGIAADLSPLGPQHRSRCTYKKLQVVIKAQGCSLKLHSKAAKSANGDFLEPDPAKYAQCRDAVPAAFAAIEAKGGCDTTGDAAAIGAKLDAFVADMSTRLSCPCS